MAHYFTPFSVFNYKIETGRYDQIARLRLTGPAWFDNLNNLKMILTFLHCIKYSILRDEFHRNSRKYLCDFYMQNNYRRYKPSANFWLLQIIMLMFNQHNSPCIDLRNMHLSNQTDICLLLFLLSLSLSLLLSNSQQNRCSILFDYQI